MSGPGAFTVRVLGADGVPAGIGALAAERHVLTCAHVVNVALGRDEREQGQPTGEVTVDFPLLDGVPAVRASVGRWLPPPRPGAAGDDLAVLALDGAPPGAVPARLAVDPPRPGRTVRVFGCPRSRLAGGWVEATVQGTVTGGRLQLDSRAALRVERGFSGSPVFDEDIGQVVGLVALAPARAGDRDSYAISAERLRLAWPGMLTEPDRRDREDAELTILHVPDLRFGRPDDMPAAQLTEHRADLMVVTGDLTERARPSEYRRAVEFLTALSAAAGIPRRHVAIVPGSHDVSRAACQAYFAERESREAEPTPPYFPKWNQFAEAFSDFYSGVADATFTPDEPWTLFEMRDLNVVVAGLNSTMSDSHLDQDSGSVGEYQLRWFASRLADYKRRQWLTLAAVHDERAVEQALVRPGLVRALLHGRTGGRYQLITIRRDETRSAQITPVPTTTPAVPRDEFFIRVAEATGARYPEATVTPRPADGYLRVTRALPGGITEQWPVGVISGSASAEAIERFAVGVHAQFVSRDPQVPSELVHDGPGAPEDLARRARQHGLRLRSLIEYQGLLDLRPLARAQHERLAADPTYAEQFYVPQRFRIVDRSTTKGEVRSGLVEQAISWLGADDARFVVVLGDSGRGKTSFLRQLARALPAELPGLLPILVELRTLEKAPSLEALLVLHLASQGVQDINPAKLGYMVQSGRLALLFDGFDELELRVGYDNAADYLRILLASVTDRAKVVLTSRTQHFRSTQQIMTALGERVTMLTASRVVLVEEFSARQVAEFLTKLYGGDLTRARARLDLIGHIGNLLELAHNPRMLRFISALDAGRLRAVRDREGQISAAGLYREIIDFWLAGEAERQSHRRGLPTLSKDDRFAACTALALRLWASRNPTIGLDELSAEVSAMLARLAERRFTDAQASHAIGSGSLLVRTGDGAFAFVHVSIMEWLVAAAAAADLGDPRFAHIISSRGTSRLMAEFFTDLAGHEAARGWATGTLADQKASVIAKQNALRILDQVGGADPVTVVAPATAPRHLAGVDLRDQDLNDRDLRSADLRGANLRGMQLRGTDLSGADLSGADLRGARLTGCSLDEAALTGSRWDRAALLGSSEPATARELQAAAIPGRDRADVMVEPAIMPSCVAYSPDGTLLAVGSHNVVALMDTTAYRILRILHGHAGKVRSLAFSPDGTRLALACADHIASIWDVASGETVTTLEGHADQHSVAFSPKGLLATGSSDGSVTIWQATTGVPQHIFTNHHDAVVDVAFSPDGALLATASADNSHRILDVATGETVATPDIGARTVSFSPDGSLLATASGDHNNRDYTARIWDIASGIARATFAGHSSPILDLAFSPDGTLLATASHGGTVRVWDVLTEAVRHQAPHDSPVRGVAFRPDGAELAVVSDGSGVVILDLVTGSDRIVRARTVRQACLGFSPDGATVAAAFSGTAFSGSARVWDLATGTARTLPTDGGTSALAFSADGTVLAISSPDRTVLADPVTCAPHRTLDDHGGTALAFSPSGDRVATCGSDGMVRTWDTATGGPRARFRGHEAGVRDVAFSPDGGTLASASDDGTIRLWDATKSGTRGSLARVPARTGEVYCVAFCPEGTELATGGRDGVLRIWDLPRPAGPPPREKLAFGHDGAIYDVAFSPDGYLLAVACGDGAAWIWQRGYGRALDALRGHAGPVRAVAFSPDGNRLATAAEDNTIRVWDPQTAEPVMTLVALADGGYAALAPDGRYKLNGNPEGRLWWAVKLCRFRPGELDDYVAGLTRLPEDAPLSL